MQTKLFAAPHFLFDLDGTLADSMPHWCGAMTGVLDAHHVPYGDDLIRIITPLGADGTAAYFRSLGCDGEVEDIKREIFTALLPLYRDVIPPKPHVPQALRALRERGRHLHVLTASPHLFLDPFLQRCGLWELFDNVWSCDDFGTDKSNPEIYRMAALRIGAPIRDVTFLDDNINACRAALQSGIGVVGVEDASGEEFRQEFKQLGPAYITSFADLASAVRQADGE